MIMSECVGECELKQESLYHVEQDFSDTNDARFPTYPVNIKQRVYTIFPSLRRTHLFHPKHDLYLKSLSFWI